MANWNILAQPIAEPTQFNPLAAVNAYRQGEQDYRVQRKDNALVAAGQKMAAGDLTGAQSALYGAGEIDSGWKIGQHQREMADAERGRMAVEALSKTDPRYAHVYRYLSPKEAISMWQHVQQGDHQSRSLDIQEKWRRDQASIAQQKVDNTYDLGVQKMKMSSDLLRRLGDNPTQAQWDEHNKPGGLIYTQFQGPVPYEQRGIVLAQLKRRQQFDPTEQDYIDLGLSDEQIRAIREQNLLRKSFGYAGHGKQWVKDPRSPTGFTARDVLPDPKLTPQQQQALKSADAAAASLSQAEEIFSRSGKTSIGIKMLMERSTGEGGWVSTDAAKFLNLTRRASTDINFFLSGKSVSNAEREFFLATYAPKPTDSPSIMEWKLKGMREFLNIIRGKSDEEIQQAVLDFNRRTPGEAGPASAAPAPGPAKRTPSDSKDALFKEFGVD